MKRLFPMLLAALCVAVAPPAPAEDAVREIDWLELIPEDELKALETMPEMSHSGSGPAYSFDSERTVAAMDGVRGKLGGFLVPLSVDAKGRAVDLFLVPYFGACIHMPPPPPNQIVYLKPAEPILMPGIWDAYWVHGTLRVRSTKNQAATSAYSIEVEKLEKAQ